MKSPPGYENSGKVWRLRKARYVLKQAARTWHHKVRDALKDFDFLETAADPSFFVSRSRGSNVTFVLTYVDGMLIAGSKERVDHSRKALMKRFKRHYLGEAKFFL
jgi:hypothetical protein